MWGDNAAAAAAAAAAKRADKADSAMLISALKHDPYVRR